jgi:hypothetical protein
MARSKESVYTTTNPFIQTDDDDVILFRSPLRIRSNFSSLVGMVFLLSGCHHILLGDKCDESVTSLDISNTSTLWHAYQQVSSLPEEEAHQCFRRALMGHQPETIALGAVGLWASGNAVDENLAFNETLKAVVALAAKISEPVARTFLLYEKYPGDSFDNALIRHVRVAETDDVRVLMTADSWMERIPPPVTQPQPRWGANHSHDAASLDENDGWVAEAVCQMTPTWQLLYLKARGALPSFRTRPGFRSTQVFLRWVAAAAGGDSVGIVTKKNEEGVDVVKDDGLCKTDNDCLPWRTCAAICSNGEGLCVGKERIVEFKNKFPNTVFRILSVKPLQAQ